jgi:hypothetical protein
MKSIQSGRLLVLVIVCLSVIPVAVMAIEPSLSGDFPFDNIKAIYSGPFTHADRSDLLVVEKAGGLMFGSHHGGVGSSASKLALYSFDGAKFQKIWENGALMLEYSLPTDGPISATTWCCGDFDGDGRYSIITCNVNCMSQYQFVDSIFTPLKKIWPEVIRISDKIWIDQMIACDINGDGKDEIVTLNYPDNPDSCCLYHAAVYKIVGEKRAAKSLEEIWHGTREVGSNGGIVPPDQFISKCRIEGIDGEVPVIMGSQSDMSLSYYEIIAGISSKDYEVKHPFPEPPQLQFSREDFQTRGKLKIPRGINENGPICGTILNDDNRILHYGYFQDYNNPDPSQKLVDDQFALLEKDHWKLLQKDDPSIGGLLTGFTIAPGKSGWLFIKDGKYSFYDRLPVIY